MQENVLAESSMMVPETRQRLEAALADLQSYVVGGEISCGLSGCEAHQQVSLRGSPGGGGL